MDKKIDYLDLRIHLPREASDKLHSSLKVFLESHDEITQTPKIRDEELLINSDDFISFLGYLNPKDFSEFELRQLKAEAKRQMQQLSLKTVSPEFRNHYTWCITVMGQHKVGRFL